MESERIVLGNGSHELLMQFAQVFSGPGDEVLASQFGFAVYALAAQAAGARFVAAPALPRSGTMPRGHDLDALLAAITPRTRLVYLANPNNPTGTWFGIDALRGFMQRIRHDVIVVVDEAYAEFVSAPEYASALSLVSEHPNLVVTRTFSKAHALAGLRVGYAIANPGCIAVMERVRESFNVNALGLAAAQASLADTVHLSATVAGNAARRDALASGMAAQGWFVHPSQANFLLVEFGADAPRIESHLLARGIVVRPMGGYGLGECLRITVGDDAQNAHLLQALSEWRA